MWEAVEKHEGNDRLLFVTFHPAPITVIWLNEDGTELDRGSFTEGENEPTTDKTPVSAEGGYFTADNQFYSYCFDRWDDGSIDETFKYYRPIFTTKKPSIDGGTVSVVNESEITYTASNIPSNGYLVVIRYDDGQMTDFRLITDPKETDTIQMQGTGSEYKIMVASEDFVPVCVNWSN